jgi:hypothetical protein
MARNTEKHEKWEMHTVGPGYGITLENEKNEKLTRGIYSHRNMARNTERGGK